MRYSGNQSEPMRNNYKQQLHWQNLYLFHNKSWSTPLTLHNEQAPPGGAWSKIHSPTVQPCQEEIQLDRPKDGELFSVG